MAAHSPEWKFFGLNMWQQVLIGIALGGLIWIWLLLHASYATELRAEKYGVAVNSLPWIIGAIILIPLAAWLVKEKMMKHASHHEDDRT